MERIILKDHHKLTTLLERKISEHNLFLILIAQKINGDERI